MTMSRRGLGLIALSSCAAPAVARAQTAAPWPQARPIRFIVPFAPGGTTDIIARILTAEMSRRLGQTILVENRPGAGATLGTGQVAQAAPDGYTLVLSVISAMVVGKVLYGGRVTWDPDRDFAHVAMVMSTPYLILVRPDFPARSLAELVALAKRDPDALSYGSSGIGSMPHLVMMRFQAAAGITMTHVPYRGAAQIATDIAGGVLPMMVDSLTGASANFRSGALRPLAHSWPERIPAFPDIPTFRELGFEDLVVDGWSGIAAPARTPRPILERLADVTREALEAPDVVRRYAETATARGRLPSMTLSASCGRNWPPGRRSSARPAPRWTEPMPGVAAPVAATPGIVLAAELPSRGIGLD